MAAREAAEARLHQRALISTAATPWFVRWSPPNRENGGRHVGQRKPGLYRGEIKSQQSLVTCQGHEASKWFCIYNINFFLSKFWEPEASGRNFGSLM